MKIDSLRTLLEEELKDIYSAEKQFMQAMPRIAKKASSQELKTAMQEHMEETRGQVERLERVFELLGSKAKAKTCEAMKGLIREATEMSQQNAEDAVLDAGIIAMAQKIEHYEIASYGTVRTWARIAGLNEAAELLQETLDEEGATDKRLNELAESFVNPEADALPSVEDMQGGGGGGKSSGGKKSSGKKSSRKSSGGKKSSGGGKSSGGKKSGGKKSGGKSSR
jgi:ferritin-like metal-binding protein YciE